MTGCVCEVLPSPRVGCCCLPLRWATFGFAIVYEVLSAALIYLFGASILVHRAHQEELTNYTLISYGTIVLTAILQLFAGFFLIFATIKKSPDWMWPWICVSFFQSVGLIVTASLCAFSYIYLFTSGQINDNSYEALTYAVFAIYGIVLYYATGVVNSYRKQLYAERADRSDNQEAEMAPLSPV